MPFLSLWPIWKPKRRTEKQTSCPAGGHPPVSSLWGEAPTGQLSRRPNATVTQLSPWMDPFNNSQQNTKKKTWIQHKHIMVVCVFLSSSPAWELSLVGEYSIRSPAGWSVVQHPGKHNTHFPTEHHTEESQGGEEERRRSISTTQHLQHSTCSTRSQSEMCPPGPSQHKSEKCQSLKKNIAIVHVHHIIGPCAT